MLLSLFSLTQLPPLLIAWWLDGPELHAFLSAFLIILITGLILWFPVRNVHKELRMRDGFIVVMLFWAGLGLSGAIPLILSESPHLSVTDAVFESISGLTTTGATVLTGIDYLPKSLQFYRQELQWLGGMGIIVLAVAILPILGIGGMQLYRAETPGPLKDSKLTPRITETAKALWYIYLSMTIACAFCYWLAGMTPFDAIAHSFSTISIGGFSTHDMSIGYYNNVYIEATAVVFMVMSGINFTLHYLAWQHASFNPYRFDSELKAYLVWLAGLCLFVSFYLEIKGDYDDYLSPLAEGIFQTVSIATTTGFTTAKYYTWPDLLPVLLIFSSFVGACAGSTGGGLKVIRVLLLFRQGLREIRRLVHPNAIITVKINNKSVHERVINAIWGFFATYISVFAILMLSLMATGLDQVTAFSAMGACINNMGPGLGAVSDHYGYINDVAKWILCIAMLLGRLEIFTLLVLLTPTFWRK
ncbi:MAG TPA: TrkH family potassium uptake protein [Gammaproteobacteria bacterium]|nr:TrkH family potassium uptake protein [Gammaproteobacteria bacterium]